MLCARKRRKIRTLAEQACAERAEGIRFRIKLDEDGPPTATRLSGSIRFALVPVQP